MVAGSVGKAEAAPRLTFSNDARGFYTYVLDVETSPELQRRLDALTRDLRAHGLLSDDGNSDQGSASS